MSEAKGGQKVRCEALIIGAGPAGLFAAFQLGMAGVGAHVVDVLPHAGGQCVELYPQKPIYDIPAHPRITGRELARLLLEQAGPFAPVFHFGEAAQACRRLEEGGFAVRMASGLEIEAAVVVIAAGGGSIQPKKPPLKGLADFEGRSVFFSVADPEALRGHDIVVAGGGDSALDWAMELAPLARRLTLLHRRAEFRAAAESVRRMKEMAARGELDFRLGQIRRVIGEGGALRAVEAAHEGESFEIPASRLLLFFGLSNKLGPLAEWGMEMEGGRIVVNTRDFETSIPGIFAIGDVCVYPGKLKLILSAFHEAALMAQGAVKHVRPGEHHAFVHSTSSEILASRRKAAGKGE